MNGSYYLHEDSQVVHIDCFIHIIYMSLVLQKFSTILDMINYLRKQPIFLTADESILLNIGVPKL